jgi:NTE family protein
VVGLVLSGGGARGFAHLGVLKVLHELRVPVDLITGTSMGSVVGGVFATGLTYPQLEALVQAEDWGRIFQNDPSRRELPMRRKRLSRQMPLGPELGVGLDGLRFPPALVGGSKLTNALQAYTFRASGLRSFDELPIPYRAVAADLEDGSMVVLDGGNLADAMRASMAVPAAFSPWEIDGRLLVDGGIVRNLPVDVARAMGAEVIIAVDVSTPLAEAPDPESAIDIARRLTTIITAGNTAEQVALLDTSDVYVKPDLADVGSADFGKLEEAMAAGEAAARSVAPALRALSVSDEEFRATQQAREDALPSGATLRVAEVVVDTSRTRLAPGVIQSVLEVEPGDTLTPQALRDHLTRVVGYGGFEEAEFRVDRTDAGDRIEVRPTDKTWGPPFLRPALSLTDQQRGTGAWSLRAYLEWTRLSAGGGEAWSEVEVGTRHGIRVWSHLPLEDGERLFLTGFASLGRREVVPEVAGVPFSLDLTDREALMGLGVRLAWFGDLIAGMRIAHNTLEAPPDLPDLEDEVWNERALDVRLDIDVLDRVVFPSSGWKLRVDYSRADSVLGGNVNFEQLRLEAEGVASVGPVTGSVYVLTSSGLGTVVPFYRAETLGGIGRLTGLERDAVWGGYAALARASIGYRFGADAGDPGDGLRLGFSAEAGEAQAEPTGWSWPPDDLRWGGSIWLGIGTPLGPVTVAFADVEGRAAGWVFQIGVPR